MEILSDGNGRFATCRHGGATPGSPLTGQCGACRCYQYTEWRGCTQCRQPHHPPGGCEGSGWWCEQVCCSWTTLEETQGVSWRALLPLKHESEWHQALWTHSFQNKSGGSLDPQPNSLKLQAQTPSQLGRTFYWKKATKKAKKQTSKKQNIEVYIFCMQCRHVTYV